MKTEKLNQLKKYAEVVSVFGDAKNVTTLKTLLKTEKTINKVENLTTENVINVVLKDFDFVFKMIDKKVRGFAKRDFCAAVRLVVSNFGALTFIDNKGCVDSGKVLNKFSKKENTELLKTLSSYLLQDASKDVDTTIKINAAVDTLTELLNEYKKVA